MPLDWPSAGHPVGHWRASACAPPGRRSRRPASSCWRLFEARQNAAVAEDSMTGLYDRTPRGHGHNHPPDHAHDEDEIWERWSKKRVFVRQLEGTYSNLYQALVEQPRVYSSRDIPWKGGPQLFGKHVVSPQAAAVTQSIETHIEVYAPGAYGQKHGHLNSAVFYVLKGRGHDVHDGKRID